MSRTSLMWVASSLIGASILAAGVAQADSGIGSEAPGRIAGVVYDYDQPLENASLTLVDRQGSVIKHVLSDHRGVFRFADVPPAKYTLYVESDMGRARREFEVRAGQTMRVRFVF